MTQFSSIVINTRTQAIFDPNPRIAGDDILIGTLDGQPLSTSDAYGIDDNATVVGSSDSRAFLWTQTEGIADLNDLFPDSDWIYLSAQSISPNGRYIAGRGVYQGTSERIFLISIVPESNSARLVTLAVVALAFIQVRRTLKRV